MVSTRKSSYGDPLARPGPNQANLDHLRSPKRRRAQPSSPERFKMTIPKAGGLGYLLAVVVIAILGLTLSLTPSNQPETTATPLNQLPKSQHRVATSNLLHRSPIIQKLPPIEDSPPIVHEYTSKEYEVSVLEPSSHVEERDNHNHKIQADIHRLVQLASEIHIASDIAIRIWAALSTIACIFVFSGYRSKKRTRVIPHPSSSVVLEQQLVPTATWSPENRRRNRPTERPLPPLPLDRLKPEEEEEPTSVVAVEDTPITLLPSSPRTPLKEHNAEDDDDAINNNDTNFDDVSTPQQDITTSGVEYPLTPPRAVAANASRPPRTPLTTPSPSTRPVDQQPPLSARSQRSQSSIIERRIINNTPRGNGSTSSAGPSRQLSFDMADSIDMAQNSDGSGVSMVTGVSAQSERELEYKNKMVELEKRVSELDLCLREAKEENRRLHMQLLQAVQPREAFDHHRESLPLY